MDYQNDWEDLDNLKAYIKEAKDMDKLELELDVQKFNFEPLMR